MATGSSFAARVVADVVSDAPIATLESARSRAAVADVAREHPGETPFTVFAESRLVFGLRGSLSVADPCPRCVLFHIASDAEQVSALREETGGSPSLPSVDEAVLRELGRRSEATRPTPALVAHDRDADSWFRSAPVHKHPLCSHEGFPERSTTDPRPVEDADDLEATLLDPHFGILRRVDDVRSTTTDALLSAFPDFYIAQSRALNPAYYRFPDRFGRFVEAGGAGRTPEMARIRGLMEGVERFGMLVPRPVELVAARNQLDEPHQPLSSFHLYSDAQYSRPEFSYTRYDESVTCEWVETRQLGTDESVYVPADLVFMTPAETTTNRFVYGNSNGCAAHLDLDAALVEGVIELFERDATMHHWYSRSAKPQVRLATLPAPHRRHVRELESVGYDVRVVDVTRYPPFYCFAVFLLDPDRDDLPSVVPAAGCALDTEDAMEKAFREALDILLVAATSSRSPVESKEDVERTEDHFDYYQRDGGHRPLEAFLEPAETVAFESESADASLSAVVEAAAENDATVYARELTPPSLRRHGVHVVRTVSPDLIPITFGYGRERLSHPTDPVPDDRPDDRPHPYP